MTINFSEFLKDINQPREVFDIRELEFQHVKGDWPYLHAWLITEEELEARKAAFEESEESMSPEHTWDEELHGAPYVMLTREGDEEQDGKYSLTVVDYNGAPTQDKSLYSDWPTHWPYLDRLFGGREEWQGYLDDLNEDLREEEGELPDYSERYAHEGPSKDFREFTPDSDPTLTYTRELIEEPIQKALGKNPDQAVVTFPEYTGRGRRPHQVQVELLDCGGKLGGDGIIRANRADGEEYETPAAGLDMDGLAQWLQGVMEGWNAETLDMIVQANLERLNIEEAERMAKAAKNARSWWFRRLQAHGGLSVADLEKLTGTPKRTVEQELTMR